ncbi:hypothetical protein BHE74_00036947 [Ensete ventricosum]|nr:hypothetical protein GW17_00005257 [Ensete ventricosum]RWW56344.1 hypothetical protein BHE74_00036947 [Ensete ventricosum]
MGWLWALPLQPSCGQESPLAGWSRAGAQGPGRYSCGLVIGKRCPLRAGVAPMAWSRASTAPCGLATGRHPCYGPGRVWLLCRGPCHSRPPPFLVVFAVKMQQECVE